MSIFRDTTKQAIAEIICENAEAGRFGLSMTEHDLESACNRIVDLFEITLELRGRVAGTPRQESKAPAMQMVRQSEPVAGNLPQLQSPSVTSSAEISRKLRVPLSESELHKIRSSR
jgi:hypothetical protein